MAETITEDLVDRIKHRLDDEEFDVNQMYQTDIRINMHFFEGPGESVFIEQVDIRKCTLLFWLCTRDDDKYSDVLDKILNNRRCELDTAFVWSFADDSPDAGTISALRAAVNLGNYDVTKKLLQSGARIKGYSELCEAVA